MKWKNFELDEPLARWLRHVGARRRHRYALLSLAHLGMGRTPGRGMVVDHINGDRSDNRRANLQSITQSENVLKAALKRRSRPFRNVRPCRGKFIAEITIARRRVLRRFGPDPEALAREVDAVLRKLDIAGMRYNFPRSGEYGIDGELQP